MRVELNLPFPPSTNRLWRIAGRRLINSREYESWKKDADTAFYLQFARKKRPERLGSFDITVTLDHKRRGRSDGDNRLKGLMDWLQRAGIIANDCGADDIRITWGEAPEGCHVVLDGEPLASGAYFK